MNSDIDLTKVKEYISQLRSINWFSQVGIPLKRCGIHLVNSWEEAYQWTNQPITEWCCFEAKMIVYRFMSSSHLEVFAKWNDVARAILPSILEVTDIARTCFPDNVPDHAVKRVQSYLVGAASELYYDNYISCHLSRNIIDIYRVGHFPCGWHVESEEAFPEKATVVVF